MKKNGCGLLDTRKRKRRREERGIIKEGGKGEEEEKGTSKGKSGTSEARK
jgi:hypothetical protein